MLLNILRQINWVDILVICLLLRTLYVSTTKGFAVELFKLIGIISSIYVSLHYFIIVSDFLMRRVGPKERMPLQFMDFLVFVLLLIAVYLIFALVRNVACHFFKAEVAPALSKWGALILGLARGILTVGLLVFMLAISTIPYFKTSAKKSYSGQRLFNIVVSTYRNLWNGVMHKFTVNEQLNGVIDEIQGDFNK